MSKIEDIVMKKIQARAVLGRNKEEALDLAVYLQKLIMEEE